MAHDSADYSRPWASARFSPRFRPAWRDLWVILAPVIASVLLAQASAGHGEYHDVVRKLTQRIEAAPENTKLRYQLAAAHVGHDEWELALAECDRIERIAPGKHQLGYLRGRSLATAGRWREAIVPLDAFLASMPQDQEALVWRARAHLHERDSAKAFSDYRRALQKSKNPEHHAEFARALTQHDLADQAVAALRHGLALNPDDPALLECKVACASTAGDHDEALAAMDRLIRTWPRPEPWMLRRAKLLGAIGRNDEALASWKSLAAHLKQLPNLERALPFLLEIESETNAALGITNPAPVVATPAPEARN